MLPLPHFPHSVSAIHSIALVTKKIKHTAEILISALPLVFETMADKEESVLWNLESAGRSLKRKLYIKYFCLLMVFNVKSAKIFTCWFVMFFHHFLSLTHCWSRYEFPKTYATSRVVQILGANRITGNVFSHIDAVVLIFTFFLSCP